MGILLPNETISSTMEMKRKVLELTRRQQATVVEEYWSVQFNGTPNMSSTSMAIDKWIEDRYNCKIFRPTALTVNMYFNQDKDITFFLLNHP